MLLTGVFLAGVFVAVVFLEFDQFDKVPLTVTIDGLALLSGILALWSGIMVWAYVWTSRWRTGQDVASRAAFPPLEGCAEALSGKEGRPELHDEVVAGPVPGARDATDGSDGRDTSRDQDFREDQAEAPVSEGTVRIVDPIEYETTSEKFTSPPSARAGADVGVETDRVSLDLSAFRRSLTVTWSEYLQHGDGHFNAAGLREKITATGIEARVRNGDAVRATDNVLLVETATQETGRFFVVPNFTKSPRAAPDWFEDVSDGALTRRTQKLYRLAEGKWTDTGFVVVRKGTIA